MGCELDARRKKLLYRSQHRGMKEADLLLGGFVERHMNSLSDDEVTEIEKLLDESDNDLVNWILGREPVPTDRSTGILLRLMAENAET